MERCETCNTWVRDSDGCDGNDLLWGSCSSKEANDRSQSWARRYDFGCPFHEPRPAPLTCGGCDLLGSKHLVEAMCRHLHLCRLDYEEPAMVSANRPACQHHKAKPTCGDCEEFGAGKRDSRYGDSGQIPCKRALCQHGSIHVVASTPACEHYRAKAEKAEAASLCRSCAVTMKCRTLAHGRGSNCPGSHAMST